MEIPNRRHTVKIEIGADEWEDVLSALDEIASDLSQYGDGVVDINSGGPSCGYTVTGEVDPDMTHARYFELVHAYLAERKRT